MVEESNLSDFSGEGLAIVDVMEHGHLLLANIISRANL
jgi:hypothetical protein